MRLRLGRPRTALIVAPHPDDEVIGASGLIRALLRQGARVRIVIVTDGAGSHRHSAAWPTTRLVAGRRRESRRAVRRLGVTAGALSFLGLPDGGMDESGVRGERIVRRAIRRHGPDLLIGPALDDAHPDHRRIAEMLAAAPGIRRRLAYRVWPPRPASAGRSSWLRGQGGHVAKRSLIGVYRTQLGAIRDDPAGFAIARHELAAFAHPVERFMEGAAVRPIDLDGFAAKFSGDDDPWGTFSNHDEAVKRRAILHAIGTGPIGRVLELASGNGSNSAAIAPRALRLEATEGTAEGVALTARAIRAWPRAEASLLALPGRPSRDRYDAIVVAELLYYLSPRQMARVARDVAGRLRPGGRLVLAHHRIDFYDFVQHAAGVQRAFLRQTGRRWTIRTVRRTGAWSVIVAT